MFSFSNATIAEKRPECLAVVLCRCSPKLLGVPMQDSDISVLGRLRAPFCSFHFYALACLSLLYAESAPHTAVIEGICSPADKSCYGS